MVTQSATPPLKFSRAMFGSAYVKPAGCPTTRTPSSTFLLMDGPDYNLHFHRAISGMRSSQLLLHQQPSKFNRNLSGNRLSVLKAKSEEDGNTTNYRSFEILTGHVGKCMCKDCGLAHYHDTKLKIATDGRARFEPPLPPGYFGNVIFAPAAIVTAGKIQSKPTRHVASRIHDALATIKTII
ncbi:hypothetical protein L1987_08161 [Smallanthus sonchifolius]|uniref:Uncharacterized protein n=1 Tax=Smallanthus sonchifolius TaxID=185202 RepID=A0ACB9JJD5_9ASTR|nr:hypothetical protein L1987_08161 [Smallanthus sonchifolius]